MHDIEAQEQRLEILPPEEYEVTEMVLLRAELLV